MRIKSFFPIIAVIVLLTFSVSAESSSSSTSSPFSGIGLIISIIMLYQLSKSEKIAMEEADGKRIGVAGWLLFFTGLLVVSSSVALIRVISDFVQIGIFYPASLTSGIFLAFELLDILSAVATLYAAYCLWKVKPNAKKIVIGVLLFDIVTVLIYLLTPGTDAVSSVFSFIGIFGDVVMIIYFATSTRVTATYAKEAKLPKKPASSNKTVFGWIFTQAVVAIIFFAVFQYSSWSDAIETSKDKPCTEYCNQFEGITSYYFGYDAEQGGMLCQCHINDEVFNETLLTMK